MIKYLLLGIGILVNTAAWSFPYERVKSCFYAAEQGCSADVSILMSSQEVSVFSNVSEKPLLALREYYSAAQANKLNDIINLFSQADGSRDITREDLGKNPMKYARFFNIKDVVVMKSAQMGEYYSYLVRWLDKDGRENATWMELVHCPDRCYMSVRSRHQIPETHFYGLATSFPRFAGEVTSAQHPAVIAVPENKKNSVEVRIHMKKAGDLNAAQKAGYAHIAQFIQAVRKNYKAPESSDKWPEKIKETQAMFHEYWDDLGDRTAFYLLELSSGQVKAPIRNQITYADVLSRSVGEHLVGFIEGQKVSFAVVGVQFKDETQYGIFALNKSGRIVPRDKLEQDESIFSEALHHAAVITKLVAR